MNWRSHPLNGVTISGVERHVRTPADNTSIMHSFLAISVSPWEQTSLRDCNFFLTLLKVLFAWINHSKCRLSEIELIFIFFLNLHKCETSQWSNCCPFSKSHWNRLTSGHFGHSKLLSMRTGLKNENRCEVRLLSCDRERTIQLWLITPLLFSIMLSESLKELND